MLRRSGIGSSSGSRLTAVAGAGRAALVGAVVEDGAAQDGAVPDGAAPDGVVAPAAGDDGRPDAVVAAAYGAARRLSGEPGTAGGAPSGVPSPPGRAPCQGLPPCEAAVVRRSGPSARPVAAAAPAVLRVPDGPRPLRSPGCATADGPDADGNAAAVAGAAPGSADASGPLTVAGRISSAGTSAVPRPPASRACSGVRRSANWSLIGSVEPAFPTPRPESGAAIGCCFGEKGVVDAEGCGPVGVVAAAPAGVPAAGA